MSKAATPEAALKARFDARKAGMDEALRTRLHRSISWLKRASVEQEDADARFIFLWIAFNAAYAHEFGAKESERTRLVQFIQLLVSVDASERIHGLVFKHFSGMIRTLIDNQYVFEPFWKALREHDASDSWKREFEASRKVAMQALLGKQIGVTLGIVFDRLYVLRNQLVHGGATWNSQVNRQQVEDGAQLLGMLLPCMIELMLEHPELDLGEVLYPVV